MVDGKLFYIKNFEGKKKNLKNDFNLEVEFFLKKHFNELMIQLLGQPPKVEHSF